MDINVLIGNTVPSDKWLFFGPLTGYEKWHRTREIRLPQLMREIGAYSASEAQRMGIIGEVPIGFTIIQKKYKRISIFRSPYTKWQNCKYLLDKYIEKIIFLS